MMKIRSSLIVLVLFALIANGLFAQTAGADPASYIGSTLPDMIGRFGAPKSVYPVRGMASWQDDVVFVYDQIEFFIYGNRVWQLKLQSAYGIKTGDPKRAVSLVLGEGKIFEDYTLFQLPSKVWPIMLRVNWDASGRASGIFVYRSDF